MANEKFERVRVMRLERFMTAFDHISSRIDSIYKAFTQSKDKMPGTAYLSLLDQEVGLEYGERKSGF